MKTKTILLSILCSLVLCQIPIGCMGNNTEQGGNTPSAILTDNSAPQTDKSAEELTENNFYRLVQELSAGNESARTLVCTEYTNQNQAFSFIITLISPQKALDDFNKNKEYESTLLKLEYTEKDVDGGFSKLTLKFKKRKDEPSYTVIFAPGDK